MSPRRRRVDGLSIAAFIVAVATVGGALGIASFRSAQRAGERPAVQRYAETIGPLAYEGGRVIQEHVKPTITDFVHGKVSVEQFIRLATTWKHDLEEIRKAFAAAPAPPRLTEAARVFDESLRGYIQAVDAFERAASSKPAPSRIADALEPGFVLARQADKVYDRARGLVQTELRRVGLPESTFS